MNPRRLPCHARMNVKPRYVVTMGHTRDQEALNTSVRIRTRDMRVSEKECSETVWKIAEGLLDEAFSAAKGQNGAKKARFSY